MAVANAAGLKTIGQVFSNEVKYVELVYDVTGGDSGLAADTIILGTIGDECIIIDSFVYVETAFVSAGAATLAVGDTDTGDSILTATAVASLLVNTVFSETTGTDKYIAAAKQIIADPATADFSAGKARIKLLLVNAE